MQLLFGVDGAHFAWGRIPMGASDYAMDRYTLDETAGDTAMASFSIERDKQKLIPYIKAAQAVKSDLRFWSSPWTPPTWMKTGQKSGTKPSPFDGGNFKTDETTSKALAAYFVKFVQAYKEQGINVEVVAPQNEPNFDQNYPSCLWDKTTFTSFIGKHLGPALKDAGLGTKIMLGTMSNGDGGKDPDIAAAVLADSTAKGYCSVAGVQWGMLDAAKTSGMKSAGLAIWATEHKCGNYPWNPSGSPTYNGTQAPNDQAYAVESWGYLRDAISKVGVTSYNAWNMVLDKKGLGIDTTRDWKQNALLVVDGGQIVQTPTYHVFRHFSQFVEPGAKVVKTGANDAIAFKNPDGTIVLVMYNSGAAKTSTVAIGGKKIQFSMPGSGWATIKR
jgi:glucosylceramidase